MKKITKTLVRKGVPGMEPIEGFIALNHTSLADEATRSIVEMGLDQGMDWEEWILPAIQQSRKCLLELETLYPDKVFTEARDGYWVDVAWHWGEEEVFEHRVPKTFFDEHLVPVLKIINSHTSWMRDLGDDLGDDRYTTTASYKVVY